MTVCLENTRKNIIRDSLVLILSPKHLLWAIMTRGYKARFKGYCSSVVTEDEIEQTGSTITAN